MPKLEACLDFDASRDGTSEAENTKYHCENPETIRVVVARADGLYPAAVEVRLVDISQRGSELLLSSNLSQGEQVTLQLQAIEFDMSVPAVVRWGQLSRSSRWHVGCEFTPTLTAAGL